MRGPPAKECCLTSSQTAVSIQYASLLRAQGTSPKNVGVVHALTSCRWAHQLMAAALNGCCPCSEMNA